MGIYLGMLTISIRKGRGLEKGFRMRSSKTKERTEKDKVHKGNGIYRIISIIYSVIVLCFVGLLIWLGVLPAKYLYALIGILAVVSIFIVPVMFSRNGKPGRKKIAVVVAILLIGAFGIGTYYLSETIDFFGTITNAGGAKEEFYLIVKADAPYKEADELTGQTISACADQDPVFVQARNQLSKELDIEYQYVEQLPELMDGLLQETYPAVFMSAASFKSMTGENSSLEAKVRVIKTISVNVESKSRTDHVDVTKEPFNVLISGIDTTGSIENVARSDVNMIVTVNPLTHKVLLTSIPRDYYVNLPSKNAMDKLTHSGLYGAQETVGAIEDFMGIDINYYVKVNYSTITKLVDAIGGIDIESPYTFTTHGMAAHYTFYEGPNHLDGAMALAYSRERQSWVDGDMRRNENQQIIIQAIIEKAVGSTAILSQYTDILDAIKDNLETDMSTDAITSLIRMQLDEMPSWDIQKQALKGEASTAFCYALGFNASVVAPDETMIAEAADKIMEIEEAGAN